MCNTLYSYAKQYNRMKNKRQLKGNFMYWGISEEDQHLYDVINDEMADIAHDVVKLVERETNWRLKLCEEFVQMLANSWCEDDTAYELFEVFDINKETVACILDDQETYKEFFWKKRHDAEAKMD